MSPLSLSSVTDATYQLRVLNGNDELVWTADVTSSLYGDGRGAISYVGPCDASSNDNVVELEVLDLRDDASSIPFVNPTANGPLRRTVTCEPNRDVAVVFDLTIMRPADQGFFDIAVEFDDIFCSGKVDCTRADGRPNLLLFDPDSGERVPTAVIAAACSAGADTDTHLYLEALMLDCGAAGVYPLPLAPPLGNAYSANPEGPVMQVAAYAGLETLMTGSPPRPASKVYYNTAIALDPGVPATGSCSLQGAFTAHDGPLDGYSTAGLGVYPVIRVAIPNFATSAGLACGLNPLDDPNMSPGTGVFSDYGAADGQEFDLEVRKNAQGELTLTPSSATASAPSAPRNVQAFAGDGAALVSWDAPANDGGSAIIGYVVTSVPPSAGCTTTGETQCTVGGLANGVAYTFTVIATNAAGAGPSSSPSGAVAPAGVPGRPTIVSVTGSNGSATIEWSAPDDGGSAITGYVVQAWAGGAAVRSENAAAGSTSVTLTGLVNATYTFTVAAVNAVGPGPASDPSAEVVLNAAPDAFEAGSLVLTFSTVEGSFDLSSYGGNVDAYPAGWVSDKAVLVWQGLPSQYQAELAEVFVPDRRFTFTQTIMGGTTQTFVYSGTVANVVPEGFTFYVEFVDESDWPQGLPCCFTTLFDAGYLETATGEPGQSLLVNAPTTIDPDGDALVYSNSWQIERPDLGSGPDGWLEVQDGGDTLTVTSDILRPLLVTWLRVVRTATDGNGGSTTIGSNVVPLPKLNSAPTAGAIACSPSGLVQSQGSWVQVACTVTDFVDPDGDAALVSVASTTCVATSFDFQDGFVQGYFQDANPCSVTLQLSDTKGAVYAAGATTISIDVAPIDSLRLVLSPSAIYGGATTTVRLYVADSNGLIVNDVNRIAALELTLTLATTGGGTFGASTVTKAAGIGAMPTTTFTATEGAVGTFSISVSDATLGWTSPGVTLTVNPYVVQAAMGFVHGCARMSDGTVKCAGRNRHGQLGNGLVDNSDTTYQPQTVPGLTGVVDISGEYEATCAVTSAGEVWCWGYNSSQAIQPGGPTDIPTPFKVPGVSDAVRVFVTWSKGTYILRGSPGGRYITTIGDNVIIPSLAGDLATVEEVGTTDTSLCVRRANGTWSCTDAAVVPAGATGQLLTKLRLRSTNTDQVCALRQDGVLHCRSDVTDGSDGAVSGASGLGLDGKTNVSAFDTGGFHICAVSGGVVECRGDTRGYSGVDAATGIVDVFLGTYTACTLGANKDFNCYSGWGGYGTQLGNL